MNGPVLTRFLSSDCDFLVVTNEPVTGEQERALRRLHDEIPTRPGHWATNLEGSYAPQADLETLERLDREWLYVDRGWREMRWSTHCNSGHPTSFRVGCPLLG